MLWGEASGPTKGAMALQGTGWQCSAKGPFQFSKVLLLRLVWTDTISAGGC